MKPPYELTAAHYASSAFYLYTTACALKASARKLTMPLTFDENPTLAEAMLCACEALQNGGSANPQVDIRARNTLTWWQQATERQHTYELQSGDLDALAILLNLNLRNKQKLAQA